MSRRTTAHTSTEQSAATEFLPAAQTEVQTEIVATDGEPAARRAGRRRPPSGLRRPGLYLAVAAAGGIMVNMLVAGQPDAAAPAAAAADQPISVAAQLGMRAQHSDTAVTGGAVTERLGELAANRSQREAEAAAAAQAQAAADQAAIDA